MTYKEIDVTGYNLWELQSRIKAEDIPNDAVLDADLTSGGNYIVTLSWVEDY